MPQMGPNEKVDRGQNRLLLRGLNCHAPAVWVRQIGLHERLIVNIEAEHDLGLGNGPRAPGRLSAPSHPRPLFPERFSHFPPEGRRFSTWLGARAYPITVPPSYGDLASETAGKRLDLGQTIPFDAVFVASLFDHNLIVPALSRPVLVNNCTRYLNEVAAWVGMLYHADDSAIGILDWYDKLKLSAVDLLRERSMDGILRTFDYCVHIDETGSGILLIRKRYNSTIQLNHSGEYVGRTTQRPISHLPRSRLEIGSHPKGEPGNIHL